MAHTDQAQAVVTDKIAFTRWWSCRDPSIALDRAIKEAAEQAGLLIKVRDLLFLTSAGRKLVNHPRATKR